LAAAAEKWFPPEMVVDKNAIEIGPGVSRILQRHCARRGYKWHGVDPRFDTNESRGCYKGIASKLPFPDGFFSLGLAFDTLEHWKECGDSEEGGIAELYRVIAKDGKLIISVPIHLHGAERFIRGDTKEILDLFSQEQWELLAVDEFRKEYEPLPPETAWSEKDATLVLANSKQPKPSAWTFVMVLKRR